MHHSKALDELNYDLEELEEYVDASFRKVNRTFSKARHEPDGIKNYNQQEKSKFFDDHR